MSNELPRIGPGSRVCMHFQLRLEDGTVVEDSFSDEPLCFVMGDGSLIEGLELAIYGLASGDEQDLLIPPQEGYGYRDPDNVYELPLADFSGATAPEPGMIIGFTTPSGEEVPGMIREVGEQNVKVDFNHPLAGHEIGFRVKILEVTPGLDEEADRQ